MWNADISCKVDVTTYLHGTPTVQYLGDNMERWWAWDFCMLFKIQRLTVMY